MGVAIAGVEQGSPSRSVGRFDAGQQVVLAGHPRVAGVVPCGVIAPRVVEGAEVGEEVGDLGRGRRFGLFVDPDPGVTGVVAGVDGYGVVLVDAQNDHSVVRMDAISAVRVPGRLAEHQIEARDLYDASVC